MVTDELGLCGTILENRYRVDEAVGEGGFGVVYRATQIHLDDLPVAVKCLRLPGIHSDGAGDVYNRMCRCLVEEGRLMRPLSKKHPAILEVLDLGWIQHNGMVVPYLVLEWLVGREIRDELRSRLARGQGAFTEQAALRLLRPAIQALSVAHEAGVAHRDLKPENLFLIDAPPGIKVLDFGIAKVMQAGEDVLKAQTRITSFRPFTFGYGAPEQFQPTKYGATGPWTDVFALGLILTEMVTGKPALDGETAIDCYQAATALLRPTPRLRGATCSNGFETLCARMLAVDASSRFQSATEVLGVVDGLLDLGKGSTDPMPTQTLPDAPDPSDSHHARQCVATELRTEIGSPAQLDVTGHAGDDSSMQQATSSSAGEPAAPSHWRLRTSIVAIGVLASILVGGGVASFLFGGKSVERSGAVSQSPLQAETPGPAGSSPPRASSSVVRSCSTGMAFIQGGSFMMGSNDWPDEKPVHEVSVNAFCIDRTEVTVEAYEQCVEVGSCTTPVGELGRDNHCNWAMPGRDNHPINCVDLNQAETYCGWAGKVLPSEAQWEYAARGGSKQLKFPWGASPPGNRACWSGKGNDAGHRNRHGTCPVGSYLPGPFGLVDMAGNVYEWTSSGYTNDYSHTKDCTQERCFLLVARGGSWATDNEWGMRTTQRFNFSPPNGFSVLGFRCARPLETSL